MNRAARKRRTAWTFIAACVAAIIALAIAGRLGAYGFAAGFAAAAVLDALIAAALLWLRAAGVHDPGEDTSWSGDPCPYPVCHHNQQQRGEEAA